MFKKNSPQLWSTVGSRATYGLAVSDLAKEHDNLMVVTADTSTSAGLDRFKRAHPDRFIDVGISEQNMIGVASGLASEGFFVLASTFAPFQTLRCCEQIKVNLGYMKHRVFLTGLASGVVLGTLGYTHCCLEDIALMRALPEMVVVSPADSTETYKAVQALADSSQSVYLRLTGGAKNPIVYAEDYDFQIGKAIPLQKGSDVTLVACGTMVAQAQKAARTLEQKGLSVGVWDMHTIKPLDHEALREICETSRLLVTVEEHSVVGGLGSSVAEFKTTLRQAPPQIIIGHAGNYGHGGDYDYMLQQAGLTAKALVETIEQNL